MIVDKLFWARQRTEAKIQEESIKLTAINNLFRLLNEVDFSVERLPEDDIERLRKVLSLLKGNALSQDEIHVLNELTTNNR